MPSLLSRRPKESPPPLAREKRGRIGEISTTWVHDLRDGIRSLRRSFWPKPPLIGETQISYELARSIYRNDNKQTNLGTGFGRRIINATVDFMELPYSATGDEIIDEFLNSCIYTYWRSALTQMIRDACRDADTIVRIRRHDPNNKLVTPEEWEACYLEVVSPERVAIYYKTNGDISEIEVAYIRHEVDEKEENAADNGASLSQPKIRQHVLIEEITPSQYRYWDETLGQWRSDLEAPNTWGFVPLVECHNEYDAALEGGQSDFEAVLPFLLAFHDVFSQGLMAHKTHSVPKAKFKVNDMMQFIANNWPDAFETDANGIPDFDTFSGKVSWKGTEIFFMEAEEDVEFLEAKSVLGDTKTLLDFILQCIAIASETPKSALLNQTAQDTDEMVTFSKKINRKRGYFIEPIQMICKMVLSINLMPPTRVPLSWEEITPELALQNAQTLQQNVMSHEVLATREVISDRTVRESLRSAIPAMKSPDQEAKDAKSNKQIEPAGGATSSGSVSGSDSGNSKTAGNQN